MRRGEFLAVAVVSLLATEHAGAHPGASSARAEALYEEGKRLYDVGRFDDAAVALAASERAEPKVGTLGMLAACEEARGRLASAWRAYRQAATLAAALGDPREAFAHERAAQLEPRLASVVVREDGGAADVLRNGEPVRPGATGSDTYVDAGEVWIEARAPGKVPWRSVLRLLDGQRATVDVPPLAALEAPPRSTPTPAPDAPTARHRPGWAGALTWVGGTVGVIGVGVGTGFGLAALRKRNDSDRYCDPQDHCAPEGGALRDDARTLARVSTVGFGVGLVGVGVAVTAALTSPRDPPASRATSGVRIVPAAGATGGGAFLDGRF